MNAPTDEEAAAIAAALQRYVASQPQSRPVEDSSWRDTARRESVLPNVPWAWRTNA